MVSPSKKVEQKEQCNDTLKPILDGVSICESGAKGERVDRRWWKGGGGLVELAGLEPTHLKTSGGNS